MFVQNRWDQKNKSDTDSTENIESIESIESANITVLQAAKRHLLRTKIRSG